jgi:hypothetical protein
MDGWVGGWEWKGLELGSFFRICEKRRCGKEANCKGVFGDDDERMERSWEFGLRVAYSWRW